MACFGSRTRTGDGRIEKRKGESMTLVYPSGLISIGTPEVTSNVGVAHDETPPKGSGWPDARGGQERRGRLASTKAHTKLAAIRPTAAPKLPNVVPYPLSVIWMGVHLGASTCQRR